MTAGGWLAACLLVTEDLMATRAHHYLASPKDHYLFVTGRALAFERSRPDRPTVVLMGASALAAATPTPQTMVEMIGELRKDPVHVEKLVCHDLSILESISLAERFPARFDGVVVIELNPRRISRGMASFKGRGRLEYRLGFLSDVYERTAARYRAPVRRTHNYFWDNRDFFLARVHPLIESLREGPLHFLPEDARTRAGYDLDPEGPLGGAHGARRKRPRIPQAQWDREKRLIQAAVKTGYEAGLRIIEAELVQLASRLREHGDVKLVLLECPIAPRTIEDVYGPEMFAQHVRNMEQMSATHPELDYWNLNDEDGLEDGDYYDMVHVNSADAVRRFGRTLARRLASASLTSAPSPTIPSAPLDPATR